MYKSLKFFLRDRNIIFIFYQALMLLILEQKYLLKKNGRIHFLILPCTFANYKNVFVLLKEIIIF